MNKAVKHVLLWATLFSVSASAQDFANFKEQTIDSAVAIGYGTAIGDVNGDKKPDILLADKKQFVWYENPSWKKHVMAENLTPMDNVCIAARDIDGDGKVEVAVGGQWQPGDTINSGAVFYLHPEKDRTKRWKATKLHHEPVVHRMRWVNTGENKYQLVVAPLHGKGNRGGKGAGVKLLAYTFPAADKRNDAASWTTHVLDQTLHVTHNFDPTQWNPHSPSEEILYIGREGVMLIDLAGEKPATKMFPRVAGGGEVRMGMLSKKNSFLVTIEPLHGDKLVVYPSTFDYTKGGASRIDLGDRVVIDDTLNQGHAIACADLNGNGRQEIVAGWRGVNKDKKVGVRIYYSMDASGRTWAWKWLDDNGMATEDLRIGDLDGDGRQDIVAAGRNTKNLKIYWNQKP